ncbi:MAG: hypothetical protein KDB07_06595, partial [Planctomycetes bacterium]|nr:hypothetical protein [Planctomycetota bacterium]
EPSHAPAEQYEVDELLQAVAGDFRPGFCVFCQKPIEMNSRDFYASPWVANTESFRESNKVAAIYAHRGCVHARMPHLLTRKGKSPYYVKEAFNAY